MVYMAEETIGLPVAVNRRSPALDEIARELTIRFHIPPAIAREVVEEYALSLLGVPVDDRLLRRLPRRALSYLREQLCTVDLVELRPGARGYTFSSATLVVPRRVLERAVPYGRAPPGTIYVPIGVEADWAWPRVLPSVADYLKRMAIAFSM